MRPPRQVFVYRKTPISMMELRPGDIFSMEPADATDEMDPRERFFVEDEMPVPQEGLPEGYYEVRASRLIKDPDYGK